MSRLFAIIFLMFPFILKAQDSLSDWDNQKLLKTFYAEQNPATALKYLKIIENRKYSVDQMDGIYLNTGYMYEFAQDFKNAKKYYLKAYDASKSSKNVSVLTSVIFLLAGIEYRLENYTASEKYFREFKSLIEEHSEGMKKLALLTDYYKIYYLNGDFDKYLKEIQNLYSKTIEYEAINKDAELTNTFSFVKVLYLYTLANTAILTKNEKLADHYISQARDLAAQNESKLHSFKNSYQIGLFYLVEARYAIIKNDNTKALEYIFKLEEYANNNHFNDYKFIGLVIKSFIQYRQNKYALSYQTVLRAIENKTLTLDFFNYELEAYRLAYYTAKELGKQDDANKYSQLFIEKSDKVLNNKKNKALSKILTYEESYSINKELKKQKVNNTKLWTVLFSVSAVLLVIVLLLMYRNKKHRRDFDRYKEIIEKHKVKQNRTDVSTAAKNKPQAAMPSTLEIDVKTKEVLKKLEAFEKTDIFTRKEMSLSYLATYLTINTVSLSSIINNHKETNFNDYINSLRINFIVHLLKSDKKFRTYKISFLAEKCGFSSHSLFSLAFKKHIGIPPSTFISFLNKEN